MRTKEEIKQAIINLETEPEHTGWGAGGNNVSDYLTALKWVLDDETEVSNN